MLREEELHQIITVGDLRLHSCQTGATTGHMALALFFGVVIIF